MISTFVMIFNSKPACNEINFLDCINLYHLLLRFFMPFKNCGLNANFIVFKLGLLVPFALQIVSSFIN